MDHEVDNIKIVIRGEDKASGAIETQIKNLRNLSSTISSLNSTLNNMGSFEKLERLASALEKAGSASSGFARFTNAIRKSESGDYQKFADGITQISNAINSLDLDGFEKIGNVSAGIGTMTNAIRRSSPENYSNFFEGMKMLSKSTDMLDNIDPEKWERFGQSASVVSKFSNAVTKASSEDFSSFYEGMKVISKSADLVSGDDAEKWDSLVNVGNSLGRFSNAIGKITPDKFSNFSEGLKLIANSIKSFGNLEPEQWDGVFFGTKLVTQLASSLGRLKPENFSNFYEGMKLVAKGLEFLDNVDPEKLANLAQIASNTKFSQFQKAISQQTATESQEKELEDTSADSRTIDETASSAINAESALASFNNTLKTVYTGVSRFSSVVWKAGKGLVSFGLNAYKSVSPLYGLVRGLRSTSSRLRQIYSDIMRIAKYRIIRSVIRAITQGFSEGIKNAYEFAKATNNAFASSMDSLATSSQYLKNSLGALAMPLINIVAPAIDMIVDKFVAMLNVINRVFAMLSGASTWTKAIKYPKSFGDAMQGAAGSAKKAAKDIKATILGIDEINPLNDQNDPSSGGGGGAGGAAEDYASMFETVALEQSKFADNLKRIFEPFKKAWENEGKATLDSMQYAFESIKGLAGSIWDDFLEVWNGGSVQKTIENYLTTFQGINRAVGNIASGLKEAWDNNGNGKRILENIAGIFEDISGAASDIANDIADWAADVDFNPLVESLANLTGSIKKFIDDVLPLIKKLIDLLEPILQWIIEKGLPGAINTAGTVLEAGGELIKGNPKGASDIIEDAIDKANKTGAYSGGQGTFRNPNYDPTAKLPQENWLEYYLRQASQSNAVMDVFKNGKGKATLTIDMLEGNISKAGEIIQYMQEHSGTSGGRSVGAKAKLQTNITSKTDNITDKILSIFGIDTRTISLGYEMDGTQNKWDIKQWLNTKTKSFFNWLGYKQDGTEKQGFFTTWRTIIGRTIKNILGYNSDGSENNSNTKTWRTIVGRVLSNTLGYKMDGSQGNSNVKNWQGTTSSKSTFWKILGFKTDGSEGNSAVKNWFNASSSSVYKSLQMNLRLKVESIVAGKSASSGNTHAVSIIDQRFTYAQGGFPASGSVFVANENGPEYVGKFGSGTAVANNDQIVEGISQGVANANMEQNRLLREQNELLRALLEKDNGGNATSSSDVLRALSQMNRRTGRPVVSMN